MEKAKIQKFKFDILSDFQTLWRRIKGSITPDTHSADIFDRLDRKIANLTFHKRKQERLHAAIFL